MNDVAAVLRNSGIAPLDEVDSALDLFGDSDEAWKNLIDQGFFTEEDFFRAVADYYTLEFVPLQNVEIPAEVIALLPGSFCRTRGVLPIGVKGDHIFLALTNPNNLEAIDEVGSLTGYIAAPKVVTASNLSSYMDRYLRADEELDKLSGEIDTTAAEDEDIEELNDDQDDAPIVRFVNLLIAQAVQDRASDIHVEPRAENLYVRFRIDGVLHPMRKADKGIQAGVLSRLKIMADMDIAERRKPQDGRMSVLMNKRKIDIRVAALPTVWGEKIIMRILDHSTEKRNIESLGLSPRNLEIFRSAVSKSHGMVLVTGPTGSGKSTTLYTALDEVSTDQVNVITVEDPVEKRIEGVNQVQINNKAGMTFPAALKSILRSDPDIVMIGEIRDEETATIAVEASMTGHLVLSTLHTNGAPESLARLVEMGVEPYLVGNSVSAVMAQRLARRLCENCKRPIAPEHAYLNKLEFPVEALAKNTIYGPVGCSECADTGYRGRVSVVEIMAVTEPIERLVVDGAPSSLIRKAAIEDGFVSLKQDGFRRVLQGLTTIDEVMRVTS